VQGLRARFEALTEREREVLEHVLRGQMNKEIAADLGIHERTVKLHRTAITTKLGVHEPAPLTRGLVIATPGPEAWRRSIRGAPTREPARVSAEQTGRA
jgi:DNA-binding NarL/FixJ family response regulator